MIEQREPDPRPELPADFQEWMTAEWDDEADIPKRVWLRGTASLALILNVQQSVDGKLVDHIRVLDYSGPDFNIASEMDIQLQQEFEGFELQPGLSVWEGHLRFEGIDYEWDHYFEGKFRPLSDYDWDGYADQMDQEGTFFEVESRSVPYEEWLTWPIHYAQQGRTPCQKRDRDRGRNRYTQRPPDVTCEACLKAIREPNRLPLLF